MPKPISLPESETSKEKSPPQNSQSKEGIDFWGPPARNVPNERHAEQPPAGASRHARHVQFRIQPGPCGAKRKPVASGCA